LYADENLNAEDLPEKMPEELRNNPKEPGQNDLSEVEDNLRRDEEEVSEHEISEMS